MKNKWLEKYPDDALHLLVIGGTHGNESNAVKMVSDFTKKLASCANYSSGCWWENTNISKVTVVNALNTIGLKYNEREFNGEEKRETNDLNRYFDSKEPVTKEEIMDELESIMKDVDIVVDVHNSPNILSCVSIALNKNAPAYIDWAIKNNVNFVLADCTYGSDEYKEFLKGLKPALDRHYKNNRYHPEHFKNVIKGMNLIDVLELICDWKASSERHEDGDVYKSIELNQDRFNYSDDLKSILKNTVDFLNGKGGTQDA